jgi:predicted nucleotidyltransferase
MKSLEEIKEKIQERRDNLRKQFGVTEIGLFGSYVRAEQSESSDVDILVELEKPIGFFKFLELEEYLEELIGLKVDLVTKKALKPAIGRYILDELVPV